MATTLKIKTTIVKTSLLLLVINLILACSNTQYNGQSSGTMTQNEAIEKKKGITIVIGKKLEFDKSDSTTTAADNGYTGGILKILGTKLFNNQMWVNANYNLKTKAKQENQSADGLETSQSLPTSVKDSIEMPKINCK